MKFLYEYRTPDNAKHSGVICASDREAAYAELKKQGIKPSRFAEAPGFFNKLFGKGKRWLAISVLGALCLALGLLITTYKKENTTLHSTLSTLNSSLDDATRRQVIGDAAVIEKGIRTGWADVFEHEGDRFLASFAIPGVPAAVRSTTEEKLQEALHSSPSPTSSPSLEERQIRAIVNGMKDELRAFLAQGGTVAAYGRKLVRRQDQEIGYYNRAKQEIDEAAKSGMSDAELENLWEKRNASLRAMGAKLVAFPE